MLIVLSSLVTRFAGAVPPGPSGAGFGFAAAGGAVGVSLIVIGLEGFGCAAWADRQVRASLVSALQERLGSFGNRLRSRAAELRFRLLSGGLRLCRQRLTVGSERCWFRLCRSGRGWVRLGTGSGHGRPSYGSGCCAGGLRLCRQRLTVGSECYWFWLCRSGRGWVRLGTGSGHGPSYGSGCCAGGLRLCRQRLTVGSECYWFRLCRSGRRLGSFGHRLRSRAAELRFRLLCRRASVVQAGADRRVRVLLVSALQERSRLGSFRNQRPSPEAELSRLRPRLPQPHPLGKREVWLPVWELRPAG